MKITIKPARLLVASASQYSMRLARSLDEVQAAQRLRFQVFNVELGEGVEESRVTGRDEDPFDAACDHLLVEHAASGQIVGTYRLQTGPNAEIFRGYYSAQEFDFSAFEPLRPEILELGRACVDPQHRNLIVLGLLWKGIADYARERGARYLVGCSSLSSQDPRVGASAYVDLSWHHLVPLAYRTDPLPAFECPLDQFASEPVPIPKLLRAYLTIGAKICGPPALDRQFKTIDFLTFLDLQSLPETVRSRFFA